MWFFNIYYILLFTRDYLNPMAYMPVLTLRCKPFVIFEKTLADTSFHWPLMTVKWLTEMTCQMSIFVEFRTWFLTFISLFWWSRFLWVFTPKVSFFFLSVASYVLGVGSGIASVVLAFHGLFSSCEQSHMVHLLIDTIRLQRGAGNTQVRHRL
jgi:hypothetical protein